MKKYLACFLSVLLLLVLTACGQSNDVSSTPNSSAPNSSTAHSSTTGSSVSTSTTTGTSSNDTAFKKPDAYAAVVSVTINPQMNVYIDASYHILGIEPLNDDAKTVLDGLDLGSGEFGNSVQKIIKAAKDKGFLQTGGQVNFNVKEIHNKELTTETVLGVAASATNQAAADLGMTILTNAEPHTPPAQDLVASNPQENVQYGAEYVSQDYIPDGDGVIVAGGISFFNDGGDEQPFYAVVLDAMFEENPEDFEPGSRQPITYEGKEYYRVGAGQTPYVIEFTETEILVKHSFFEESDTVALTLSLLSNGNLKVVNSNDPRFKKDAVLSVDYNGLS